MGIGACPGIRARSTPVLPRLSSSQEPNGILVAGHGSQERKGRQRLRASVFALTLPLSLGPCWALWAAVPKASGLVQGPQRRLLGSLLQVRLSQLGGHGGVMVPSKMLGEGGVGGVSLYWEEPTKSRKGGSGMHSGLLGGADSVTYSHRTTLKYLATCWVASLPAAPGLPGSPHSPES